MLAATRSDEGSPPAGAQAANGTTIHSPFNPHPPILQLRRLSINLIYTFWGQKSPEARLAESFFADPLRWAIDEDLIFAAQAASVGVSLASAPDASLNHADDSVDGEAAGPDPTGPGSKEPPGLPGTALPGYYIPKLRRPAHPGQQLTCAPNHARGGWKGRVPGCHAPAARRLPAETPRGGG